MKSTTGSTTSKPHLNPSQPLTIRVYPLVVRAIEEGGAYGLTRAFKYNDNPSPEAIREAIEEAILNNFCGLFDFGDDSTSENEA